jgi:hypothetical protein
VILLLELFNFFAIAGALACAVCSVATTVAFTNFFAITGSVSYPSCCNVSTGIVIYFIYYYCLY